MLPGGLEILFGIGVISGSFQVLLDRIIPRMTVWEFLQSHKFDETLFEKLETAMLQVNAVLSDAEEKQITNPFVRKWIDELKDAAYSTTDLLDEIQYRALAVFHASGTCEESVLKTVIQESKCKIEEMTRKLENLARCKDVLRLKDSFSGKPSPRLQPTSLVDETEVYGRGTDKDAIMKFLISTGKNDQIPAVVAIVGIAGVGKTTLAQLLYNDPEMKRRFKTRAWVYFSEDFDVFKVTRTIYESVTLQTCNIQDLNRLQVELKKKLTRKKFLIVLDDVWNEYYWDALRNFLKVGASESRIIVTTRSPGVASTMRAVHTHPLQPLEEKACRLVFSNQAFGSPCAHDASPKLKKIGEEIAKKCGGLPLAAKVLGSLLSSKRDAHEWNNILKSNIWDLSNGKSDMLPSLRLSYYNLSSHLKRCFAYCSIFPKGYEYDKEKLILLWMAEGFLPQPRSGQTMEEVGIECFHELLSNSFFQQRNDGNKSCFVMHDLINDLAQFASGESCEYKRGKSHHISKKVRHFSFKRDAFSDRPDLLVTLNDSKFLSTFLPLGLSGGTCSFSMIEPLLSKHKRLRVLSLSSYVTELTDNQVKNLLHLRYLDLSGNLINKVPESIGCLYNLQTLILSSCTLLDSLPSTMINLIHLRHLDLTETDSLKMMPLEFGKLESLRTLTKFVVRQEAQDGSSVKELGKLLHLGGKLSILELQNVRDDEDAEGADLKKKENIKELEFSWSSTGRADEEATGRADEEARQKTILEKLHPHENIEKLSIRGYGGTELPNWLGDSKFSNMVILHLSDCRNCSALPSLGQLSSLQELHVKNMEVLKSITGGFPSLQELHLRKCQRLIEIPNCLPCLKLLIINECCQLQLDYIMDYPQLQDMSIIKSCGFRVKSFALNFSSHLKSLKIIDCGNLSILEISDNLHQDLNFFQELEISKCPYLEIFSGRGLPAPNLTSFSVLNCNNLRSMPKQMHRLLSSLQTLKISGCPELLSFPEGGLPPSLRTLTIENCDKLRSMPEQMHTLLSSLQTLTISGCSEFMSFPEGGLPPSLQTLTIQNCDKLRSMPEQMHTLLNSLQTLTISGCSEFVSFPKGGLPPSLQTLRIQNCDKLGSMPEHMHNLPALQYLDISCCPELVSFTEGCLPTSLQRLKIQNCVKLTPQNVWGLRNMTSLTFLTIECAYALVASFPDEGLVLPVSLEFLQIIGFPKLKTLNVSGLQHLTLLKSLEIHSCNQFEFLSDEGNLPRSLSSLTIIGCPSMTDKCQKDGDVYWNRISHIPTRYIINN